MKKWLVKHVHVILSVLFIIYFCYLIFPAIRGNLSGTFHPHPEPSEYKQFSSIIEQNSSYSRTLWIPSLSPYAPNTVTHPAVFSQDVETMMRQKDILSASNSLQLKSFLQQASIQYIIVPDDTEKQIFIRDRKYTDSLRIDTIKKLDSISWLQKKSSIGNITIYEVPQFENHFAIMNDPNSSVQSTFISPTEYHVVLKNIKQGDVLHFSETFSPLWVLNINGSTIHSFESQFHFNQFVLNQSGNVTADVEYTPQKAVTIGLVISVLSFGIIVLFLVITKIKKI